MATFVVRTLIPSIHTQLTVPQFALYVKTTDANFEWAGRQLGIRAASPELRSFFFFTYAAALAGDSVVFLSGKEVVERLRAAWNQATIPPAPTADCTCGPKTLCRACIEFRHHTLVVLAHQIRAGRFAERQAVSQDQAEPDAEAYEITEANDIATLESEPVVEDGASAPSEPCALCSSHFICDECDQAERDRMAAACTCPDKTDAHMDCPIHGIGGEIDRLTADGSGPSDDCLTCEMGGCLIHQSAE